MKVFLDSNVLVSAYATRGLCSDLLRVVLTEHELITAEVVLQEVARVLSGKMGVPSGAVDEIVASLRHHHVEPKSSRPPPVPVADPDDARVLAAALDAAAEMLVTGDSDLLKLPASAARIRIVNPRSAWELLRSR